MKDGFTLGSKIKETSKLSDPIGQEQNFGPRSLHRKRELHIKPETICTPWVDFKVETPKLALKTPN